MIAELPLDGRPVAQDATEVLRELGVLDGIREGLDRAPYILREQVERVRNARGKLANLQLRIEKDRSHVGGRQEVLHVVRDFRQIRDLPLILRIDRVELLVDALELLIGAL